MCYFTRQNFFVVILLVFGIYTICESSQPADGQQARQTKEQMPANKHETELFCPAQNGSEDLQPPSLAVVPAAVDKNGCTALMRASENGQAQNVQMLLESGANPEAQLPAGLTSLILAAKEGHLEVVKLLLRHKANANAFVSTPHSGVFTALMYAIGSRKPSVIEALIEAGADVNPPDMVGMTPLAMAISETHDLAIVKMLLSKGADVNLRTYYGLTALMATAGDENVNILKTLLAAGANVNVQSDHGTTALMIAAAEGRPEAVKALIAAGAYLQARNKSGETALSLALRAGRKDNLAVLQQASGKQ